MSNSLCKYYKQVRQVSYDSGVTWINLGEVQKGDLYEYNSPSCGGVTEYRWVNMDSSTYYYCDGTTKYYKQKKQQSTDGGSTWQDVSPAEYQRGTVAEYQSTDCGYVPPTPPTPGTSGDYLTFVAQETGTFKFSGNSINYSIDSGNTWSTLASNTSSPTVSAGNKIMWKGSGLTPSTNKGIGIFSSTANFTIEGNVMSLYHGDDFADKTSLSGNNYAFYHLFSGCTGLTSAENLCLPATTLTGFCYAFMFRGCSGLTKAPELPSTTLANYCYEWMFADCTSLTTAPQLPATTLILSCYEEMFRGCTSLTTAPELSATTLEYRCYYEMFKNCSNLNYIKCLATDKSATSCTANWVNGVSSTGTFIKNSSMSGWGTGVSGIPNNWTVQNA